MKRLLDQEGLHGGDEQLADLLRSAAPFEVDPFRQRRVLVAVERGHSSNKWRFWLRPALALTLLFSGTAAAAIGHHYVARGSGFFGFSGAPSAASAAAPKRAPSASARQPAAAEAPSAAALDTPPSEPSAEPTPIAPQTSAQKIARTRAEAQEDASNVVEAIQALRAGHDPARAQRLLDEYLKAHPRGVLSGDALALSIEAASARNDARATDYARRYLVLYPTGKYRDLAKRALSQH
jgi:hypothetical protein